MKLASLYILTTPVLVLTGLGLTFGIPALTASLTGTSILNPGVHGFSEVLYAFTSAGNNNGSAFGGLTANTPWLNASLGAVMLLGRLLPIVFVLALAGSFAAQTPRPANERDLPTHRRSSSASCSARWCSSRRSPTSRFSHSGRSPKGSTHDHHRSTRGRRAARSAPGSSSAASPTRCASSTPARSGTTR